MNVILREDYRELASRLGDCLLRFEERHVLITGAAGFIGRYLSGFLEYLNQEVFATPVTADLLDSFVVRPDASSSPALSGGLRARYGDVSKGVTLSGKPDYIIHAAGVASPRHYTRMPVQTLEAGTSGTRRMLDLARKVQCRGMLFLSSSEVYGDPDPQHVPTNERYNGNVSTSGPRACYDESKRLGETWSFLYAREYQVPVKIVRLFNVYGPGFDRADGRVIPSFIQSAALGRPIVVHGAGAHTRTFCYVADAADAMLRVLLSDSVGEAFNIGSDGPEISVRYLAALFNGLLPQAAPITFSDSDVSAYSFDDPGRRCPDITKLQAATGYRPVHTLRSGLERTLQWYAEEHGFPRLVSQFNVAR